MSELTLCPHYLVNYPVQNSSYLEKNIFSDLLKILIKIRDTPNIKLVISTHIMKLHYEGFPWNMGNDENWKQILNIYRMSVIPALNRAHLYEHQLNENYTESDGCINVTEEIKKIFNQFLILFGKKSIGNIKNEEAIFSNSCCYGGEYKNFLIINETLDKFNHLKFPWLIIYNQNHKLPTNGIFPFIPPDNWRRALTPSKTLQEPYGYIDIKDQVWSWDRMHDDHWDVQLSKDSERGNYLNVNSDGDILS